jgi:hypothetical protein
LWDSFKKEKWRIKVLKKWVSSFRFLLMIFLFFLVLPTQSISGPVLENKTLINQPICYQEGIESQVTIHGFRQFIEVVITIQGQEPLYGYTLSITYDDLSLRYAGFQKGDYFQKSDEIVLLDEKDHEKDPSNNVLTISETAYGKTTRGPREGILGKVRFALKAFVTEEIQDGKIFFYSPFVVTNFIFEEAHMLKDGEGEVHAFECGKVSVAYSRN